MQRQVVLVVGDQGDGVWRTRRQEIPIGVVGEHPVSASQPSVVAPAASDTEFSRLDMPLSRLEGH
ncbi:MAG: hypothetical protein H0W30_10870 [Gemmatimonadaceae bacterium]|nr:hypothetical protein [Gemmatimonadaceae bacterium]